MGGSQYHENGLHIEQLINQNQHEVLTVHGPSNITLHDSNNTIQIMFYSTASQTRRIYYYHYKISWWTETSDVLEFGISSRLRIWRRKRVKATIKFKRYNEGIFCSFTDHDPLNVHHHVYYFQIRKINYYNWYSSDDEITSTILKTLNPFKGIV